MASSGLEGEMGLPSMAILPPSFAWTPVRTLIRVDFPAPFSPTSAWTSPECRVKSTFSSARTPGKYLQIPRIVNRASSATGHHILCLGFGGPGIPPEALGSQGKTVRGRGGHPPPAGSWNGWRKPVNRCGWASPARQCQRGRSPLPAQWWRVLLRRPQSSWRFPSGSRRSWGCAPRRSSSCPRS